MIPSTPKFYDVMHISVQSRAKTSKTKQVQEEVYHLYLYEKLGQLLKYGKLDQPTDAHNDIYH